MAKLEMRPAPAILAEIITIVQNDDLGLVFTFFSKLPSFFLKMLLYLFDNFI